jgi:hypothetical protein
MGRWLPAVSSASTALLVGRPLVIGNACLNVGRDHPCRVRICCWRFRFGGCRLCYIVGYSTRGRRILMDCVGSGSSSPATPRIGALPSGLVPDSSLVRCGSRRFMPGWEVRLAALALVLASTVPLITSRVDRVRRAFGVVFFGSLGSNLEQVDESESALSGARLARHPRDFLLVTAPSCQQSAAQRRRNPRSVLCGEKMKRSDRGEHRSSHRRPPVLPLDVEEFQEGINMHRVDHNSDSNYPLRDVDYPALVCVVA